MPTAHGPSRIIACLVGAAAGLCVLPGPLAAFPLDDPLHPSIVPTNGDLPAPDVQQLNHQMGLLSGFGPVTGGWTILPSLELEETFTDNVLRAHAPRQWDMVTIVRPSIAVAGDTDRLQMRLSYQPSLQVHLTTGSQNALTHQLNANGRITLVPGLLFVDVRGVAGVQAANGGIGGLGTVGTSGFNSIASGSLAQTSQLGIAKQNLYESSSFAVSPFVLHTFGDAGTARLGISLSETSTSRISGFTAVPLLSGTDGQRQTGVEETASFQTGSVFSRVRDSVSIRTEQTYGGGQSVAGGRSVAGGLGIGNSNREVFNNRVDYAWDQSISFYAQLGWERIDYQSPGHYNLNGPTWGIGTTLTPNADTNVTFGYGRQNGTTSFTFDGHYALTTRTMLAGSYHTGVTTQTSLLRNQLYASAVANNGGLVNSLTGAPQFVPYNALGLTPGVFRFSTLNLSATTVLARDTITVNAAYSTRTGVGTGATGGTSNTKTAGIDWEHLVTPNLMLNASLYYSTGAPIAGTNANSVAAGLSGRYTLSETVSAFARYALFERQSSNAALSMYQNLLIVGINKQF